MKIFFFLLWASMALVVRAQTQNAEQRVTLQLIAALDGAPVSDAAVGFRSLESSGGFVWIFSDTAGRAVCPFAGKVVAQIQAMGYQPRLDTLHPGNTVRLVLQGNGLALAPVVVTGQLSPLSADRSAFNVRVLDQERIQAQGAATLRELLGTELNIRLTQDNVLGSSMSLQGLAGQNVKIMVDNVPLIGRQNGNIDLSQINLNDIERIEIIEGPMSINYGSDALGGVVNLITKKNARKFTVGAGWYYETFGQFNANVWGGFKLKKHRLRLSGGRHFFDGWNPNQVTGRTFQWKPREQWLAGTQYEYSRNKWSAQYKGQAFYETLLNRGEAQITPVQAYALDDYFTTFRTNHDLTLRLQTTKHSSLNWLGSASYYRRELNAQRRDLTILEDQPVPGAAGRDTTEIICFLSRATWSRSRDDRKLNFQAGYEFNYETTGGDRIAENRKAIFDGALFGAVEYRPIKALVIRPGVRFTYNTAFRAPVVPGLQIKWEPNPRWNVRGAFSRGFRTPSLREMYLFFVDVNHNIQGNPELKAEHSNNANASVKFRHVFKKTSLTVEASSFFNDVYNLITLAQANPTGSLYTYINLGRMQTTGGRLEATLLHADWTVVLGATVTGYKTESSVPFTVSPEARAEVRWHWQKTGLRWAVFYKYTGQLQSFSVSESGELTRTFIQAYHTLDATVSRSFWKNRIRLAVGGHNLANVQNLTATLQTGAHTGGGGSVPMSMGRSSFVNLTFEW